MPFKDQGTAFRKGETEKLPDGYEAGAIYLEAKTYNPPGVVGPKLERLDEADLYSGCYARAKVVFKAYQYKGDGITCYLQHVQKVKDGESLAGFTKAEDCFEAIEGTETDASPAEADDMLAM
jgi:hypothetical protein